jgi:hypothetical protein
LKNDNFIGKPIILGGTTYRKGLSTHAPAKISYNLDGKYKRFENIIGLWDSGSSNRGVLGDFAGKRGSVAFQVCGVQGYRTEIPLNHPELLTQR